jgi:hypothetical protein
VKEGNSFESNREICYSRSNQISKYSSSKYWSVGKKAIKSRSLFYHKVSAYIIIENFVYRRLNAMNNFSF